MPVDFLKRAEIVPLAVGPRQVVIATARPFESDAIRALGFFLERPVEMQVSTGSAVAAFFKRVTQLDRAEAPDLADGAGVEASAIEDDVERLRDVAREAPVIRQVNRLIGLAVERRASDIHVEPLEDQVRVRFRIDGALTAAESLPKDMQAGVISRIKVMARLNIAEQRLPQDGRIKIPVKGDEIDLRVSTVPTLYGESVVLRILNRENVALDFASLGFSAEAIARLSRLIGQPNGILLVTGPTGSGKTTTLYAALRLLNRSEAKVFTVEDPIEYHLDGINQTHVRPQIGLDFANVLRSILRQDPDIIMVGEIRDGETASVAIQASLTGHLVLSTLHTNSAAASITRLLDMGVEDYLLASSLRAILAQRLVRRLCSSCKVEVDAPAGVNAHLAQSGSSVRLGRIFEPRGCALCGHTGFRGRTTIYELLEIAGAVRDAVVRRVADGELAELARRNGMVSLYECGMAKVAAGETSIDEVVKATSSL
ncbi:GspE/PulE family protein [Taklimakanibacter lacteus]|uniref:GspE/PulE family protein n=1 Tax=Taklimakanibacter lacteus TaxID=2268456 RepID=UPI003F687806